MEAAYGDDAQWGGAEGASGGLGSAGRAGLVRLGPLVGRPGRLNLGLLLLPRLLDLELGGGWMDG